MRSFVVPIRLTVALTLPGMAVVGLWLSAAHGASQSAGPVTQGGRTIDPHWSDSGCIHCHQKAEESWIAPSRNTVDLLCLECHDGVRATAEAHPIGRTFSSDQVRRPDDWPTPGGRLSCITCHEVLYGCRREFHRRTSNPSFLRGPVPPDRARFCTNCHVETVHQRVNPHIMLAAGGRMEPEKCAVCHTNTLRPQDQRVGDAQLRSDEITLCGGCHPSHVDFFSPGHIGIPMTPRISAQLAAAKRQRFGPDGSEAMLPLINDRLVGCSTCHNPHQEGLFPSDSVLALGAIPADGAGDPAITVRLPGTALCTACHSGY